MEDREGRHFALPRRPGCFIDKLGVTSKILMFYLQLDFEKKALRYIELSRSTDDTPHHGIEKHDNRNFNRIREKFNKFSMVQGDHEVTIWFNVLIEHGL